MKEIKLNLTGQGQTAYSRGGDIFMEGKGDMTSRSQPTNPEHAEAPRGQGLPASVARQTAVRKAWVDSSGGRAVSVAERRTQEMLIEKGIPPIAGGADRVNVSSLTSQEAKSLGDQVNLLEGLFFNESVLENFYKEALKLSNIRDRQAMLDSIGRAGEEIRKAHLQRSQSQQVEAERQRFGFYLQANDLEQLRRDPTIWLDKQFDVLYKFAQQGQELTSPIISNMQTVYSEAIRYLQYTDSEGFDEFQLGFTIRFHLIQNRVMIGHKNIEQIGEAARQLGVNGLLYALSMEDGKVGSMFNRMNVLLEDERQTLNKEHHVTPELAYSLQKKLIDEQMEYAQRGISEFGDLSAAEMKKPEDQNLNDRSTWDDFTWAAKMTDRQIAEDLGGRMQAEGIGDDQKRAIGKKIERIMKIKEVNANITRSVRTAYDVFVCSQRMGVIVARGRHLRRDEAYFSDPAGVFNIYNIEDLLWGKFDMYTAEQHEFVNRLKLAMAENNVTKKKDWEELSAKERHDLSERWKNMPEQEKLDLGRRLFRDIYLVPDFFTSGWRIKGITDSIQERFEGKILGEFKAGRFEGLLSPEEGVGYPQLDTDDKKEEFRNEIAKKRAEDFALFMRLRLTGKEDEKLIESREIWKKIAKYRPDEIIKIFRERGGKDELDKLYQEMGKIDSSLLKISEDEKKRGVTVYDKFKQKYGGVLGLLREKALGNGNSRDLPFQLDVSRINSDRDEEGHGMGDYKDIANKVLGEGSAEKLANLFKVMQADIGIRNINGVEITIANSGEYKSLAEELKTVKDQIEKLEEQWEKETREGSINLEDREELERQKRRIASEIAEFEATNFNDKINLLLTDKRFEDVYRRTLLVDDALLGELEQETFRGELRQDGKLFTKLSAKFSTDQEGDSLKRSWNDHANAQKAAAGLLKFITQEDPKERVEGAKEFAARTSDYNGLSARVDCIRYTLGTFLDLSKKDYMWDLLAIENGPFRKPIAEIQRIFGVQAKAFSRDEERDQLDHLRELLTSALSKEDEDLYQKMTPHDRRELREKKSRTYKELEDVLEASSGDKRKMSALSFLIYLFMAVGGEGFNVLKESGKGLDKSV